MAITINQNRSSNAKSLAFLSNVTAGHLLVVGFADSTGAVSGISDSQSNSWVLAQTGSPGSGGVGIKPWIWYTVANTTGACTVTITDSGTNFGIQLLEISGVSQLSTNTAYAQVASGTTSLSCGPIDTLLGVLSIYGPFGAETYTSSSGSATTVSANRIAATTNLTATGVYTETGSFAPGPSGFSIGFSIIGFGPSPTYGVSGNVGIAGATVSWTGTSSGSTTADGSGNYNTGEILAPGSYTITPSLAGYTFSPTSAPETITTADITGVNFTATQTKVATPTFSPVGGTYSSTQSVTLSSTDSGLSGFAMTYTTDGTTPIPGSHGTVYSGPITVSSTQTIKVVASATGYANSNEADATYTITSGGSAWSPIDSRIYKPNFATYRTVNGAQIDDVQTSSNSAVPGVDSRKEGAPIASGSYPQNSRVAPPFGEAGEP